MFRKDVQEWDKGEILPTVHRPKQKSGCSRASLPAFAPPARTQQEKDDILKVEIPTRMNSMNVMESTYPPVVMAKASKEIRVETN